MTDEVNDFSNELRGHGAGVAREPCFNEMTVGEFLHPGKPCAASGWPGEEGMALAEKTITRFKILLVTERKISSNVKNRAKQIQKLH